MAWGSKTSATQLTDITTEQYFNVSPALNPGECAHVQVTVDFPSTPTDHAVISVYSTLDVSTETWDTVPFMQFVIHNYTDPNTASFVVTGVYKFRVGITRSGTTDTLTDADLSYRTDGVSA